MNIDFRTIMLSCLITAFSSGLVACSSPTPSQPPQLVQAAKAIRSMSSAKKLPRSMFMGAFQDGGTAKQYVSYLFSSMGMSEWPLPFDAEEAQDMRAARITLLPQDVAIVPRKPDSSKGMQLVINYDNGRGMIIVQGYTDPKQAPVLEQEWSLPTVQPDPTAKMYFESNLGLGMKYQSF